MPPDAVLELAVSWLTHTLISATSIYAACGVGPVLAVSPHTGTRSSSTCAKPWRGSRWFVRRSPIGMRSDRRWPAVEIKSSSFSRSWMRDAAATSRQRAASSVGRQLPCSWRCWTRLSATRTVGHRAKTRASSGSFNSSTQPRLSPSKSLSPRPHVSASRQPLPLSFRLASSSRASGRQRKAFWWSSICVSLPAIARRPPCSTRARGTAELAPPLALPSARCEGGKRRRQGATVCSAAA